ncbi:MAG: hypothetical protein M9894_16650 [Planctomycetes bacterium]|nr:hypothetical protein [Planctomycetota bacterium]
MRSLRALAGAALFALVVALVWRGAAPTGGGGLVTGRLVGPIDSGTVVLLVDPPAGVGVPAEVREDGRFEVRVPPGAPEPWVVVDTGTGALVQSGGVHPSSPTALPPLRVWRTDVRVRAQGGRVRIDWSAIPEAEGLPPQARYSVLMKYERDDRAEGEATFPALEAALELDIQEELLPYLPHRAPGPPVEVIVRAFDPTDPRGPMWIGGRATWTLE